MTSVIEMPERIGRFRLLSMLGRGAMGVVYKGHDEHIDRLVAIKLIRADLLDSEERENYFRRFRNEAQIAGRCVHANIVGLYDYSFHEGNPYLVMEYVNGCGLQQLSARRGTLRPLEEVLPIALQVLDALQYAHERGIVHRDVKPANILLTPQSRLKITDFGISRLSSSELTMTPLLIGTPSYMSPEQCMGAELDGRSDLFSLGCVLYELLAGRRPFVGVNYTDTILGIINKPHVPLTEIRSDLPEGLSEIIDRALSKRPDDRFADANAFARALDKFSAGTIRVPALPEGLTNAVADHQQQQGNTDDTVMVPVAPSLNEAEIETQPAAENQHGAGYEDDTVLLPLGAGHQTEQSLTEAVTKDSDISHLDAHAMSEEAAFDDAQASDGEKSYLLQSNTFESDAAQEIIQDHVAVEEQSVSDQHNAPDTLAESTVDQEPAPVFVPEPDATITDPPFIQYAEEKAHHVDESDVAGDWHDDHTLILDELPSGHPDNAWNEPPEVVDAEKAAENLQEWRLWTTRCLTRTIGPIGPVVVATVWREEHPEKLVEDCARFIRQEHERRDFLEMVHAGGGSK